ncbi:MAG TPA: DUF3054 family protein [Anaerolineales bacterium]|nr:DUF3054 family protein [Anaerolineales bacterium]
MKENFYPSRISILLLGDALVLALTTLLGLAEHGSLGAAMVRLWSTFLPMLVAWLLVAPHLGAFDQSRVSDPRQLWRPFWAMVLAAPLGAWLRGLWLGSAVLLNFVWIIGGVNALAILAWRGLYLGATSKLR